MDKISQYLVDILRRKKETEVLNRGGTVVPSPARRAVLPRAVEPKHGGKTYEELIDSYGAGR